MNNGFLNIIKPDGLTSFQVIAKVRKKLGIKKVGHMGTLDPAGVGVLPLAIGKATKMFNLMQNKTKTYFAIFVFGKQTDTLDAFGKIEQIDINCKIDENKIKEKLSTFEGEILQLPPKFSAKKINGQRAYDLARLGKDFELQPKKVFVEKFSLIDKIFDNAFLFEIKCSSGTYIRSLCRDLALELNTCAYMPLIIRSEIDWFNLNNGVTLNDFLLSDNPEGYIINIENVHKLPQINLDNKNYAKIRNGITIPIENTDGKYYLNYNNLIFAIGDVSNKKLKMEIYLDD